MFKMRLKQILKDCLYLILAHWPSSGAVVLMYHSVGYNHEFFTVTPEFFENNLRSLRSRKANVISLAALVELIQSGQPIPPRTVVITFDDGYQDNLTVALPLLEKYNFPATFFVSSELLDTVITARNHTHLPTMSKKELVALVKHPLVSFQSHGRTHQKFSHLTHQEAVVELAESRQALANILDKPVKYFAFPYGVYNQLALDEANKMYEVVATTEPGRVTCLADLKKMPRNSIDSKVTETQFAGIAFFGRI